MTLHSRYPALLPACALAFVLFAGPAAEARPGFGGGLGGPASGAGVRPGAGWGAPGAGVAPGVGVGRPGPGVYGGGVWHSGWAYGGYWASRPWGYGWYGTAPLAWGVAGMATAAAISSSVNAAAVQESTVIVVPQTVYQLNYASVLAVEPDSVRFSWISGGVSQVASGNCRLGSLNGVPATAANAQLLNAACVVAYGSGS